ncbi:hypothetical protein EW026_g4411 [Hermanssonia centrifuga]|uniref:HIG1 domain-containing protein n=1 Tax=Hermanssonia centrifuga TaxID=98765 RepID=A0A4S4KH62_9APHY|nr:hypothetical protein EW026_g4411 [Hermanssonia centrifuga]
MKLLTQEEADAQQRATISGGIKGFLGGSAVALPISYLLQRKWAYYHALPPSLKAFGVILVVVPSFVISAEHAGLRHEQSSWRDAGKEELDMIEARKREKWEKMGTGERVKDWMARHQYSVILGGWSGSMVVAFGAIMRNKYQTLPQKVVQARMWAQGLTIGVLIAAGALTHAQRAKALDEGPVRHLNADHSWKDIVDHEQAAKEAARPS